MLLQGKLAALARDHFDAPGGTTSAFPGGAARSDGARGWVYAEEDAARALGKAMAWARQQGIAELHVLVDDDAGVLARRASLFRDPPTIWWVNGTELHSIQPEPFSPPGNPPEPAGFGPLFQGVGLEVVPEWDHVAGELRGLEVARVIDGRLEVGVGEADRELTAMLHGDLAPADALERVVTIVREHRRPGAPRHPLNLLVPERWLRWTLPGVSAVSPARPRVGMRERDIACGISEDGVVVCSVGVDLDLVPAAADARLAIDAEAPLIITIPERDDHPVTRALADRLIDSVEIRTISGGWRT